MGRFFFIYSGLLRQSSGCAIEKNGWMGDGASYRIGAGQLYPRWLASCATVLLGSLAFSPVLAATFTVTGTSDDGTGAPGTLSAAILDANGGDNNFISIDPSVTSIAVTGPLPGLARSVVFDTSAPVVISNGSLISTASGLSLLGSNIRLIAAPGAGGGTHNYSGVPVAGTGANAILADSQIFINAGQVTGGAGGKGSDNVGFYFFQGGPGGMGGSGGAGFSGNSLLLDNSGVVEGGRGGNGGAGAYGPVTFGDPGHGGKGGAGVSGTGYSLINSGLIMGGDGGNGSDGVGGIFTRGAGGNGGNGGSGVLGASFSLLNTGRIVGGYGGQYGTGSPNGTAGIGGAGVSATGNSTIANGGLISRGQGANAVDLSGGGNKLVLLPGGDFTGNVVSTSGTTAGGDTFALGGGQQVASNFMLQEIGTRYQGFAIFAKEGSGSWSLAGRGTSDWDVRGGTLILADGMDLTGSVTVRNGANVIASSASVNGNVTNGGSFSVASGKTAQMANFTNEAGAVLRIGVGGINNYGKVIVNNTARLDGALFIDVTSAGGMTSGVLSRVVSATAVNGTFTGTSTNSLLFNYSPVYAGDHVDLAISKAPARPQQPDIDEIVIEEGNVPSIGAAVTLDNIIASDSNGPVARLFQGFVTGQQKQLSDAVRQTLPIFQGNSQLLTRSSLNGVNRVIQARNEYNRGLASGDDFLTDKNVWVKTFGSWVNQGARNSFAGLHASSSGVVAGLDGELWEHGLLGVALAYSSSSIVSHIGDPRNSGQLKSYMLVGYGTYAVTPDTELSFQVDVGRNTLRGTRNISFASMQANSNYAGTTGHAGVGLGHRFALSSSTQLFPSIRADYTWIREAAYSESGADVFNLKVPGRLNQLLVLSTESKLLYQASPSTMLSLSAGLGYDIFNEATSISAQYEGGGSSFVVNGMPQSPYIGQVGAGLVYRMRDGGELTFRYDLEARTSFTNQTASVKLRWRF